MTILLVDNYDSFTWNLVHLMGGLGHVPRVVRNDAITPGEAVARHPDGIVVGPGPCDPDRAGIVLPLIAAAAAARVPLFGVCLGMQAIGQAFGGRVVRHSEIVHGKMGVIRHEGAGVFAGLPDPLEATRYHSLVVERATLPDALEVTGWLEDGTIMGLRHRELPIEGVQFHPESILTTEGPRIVRNWVASALAARGAGYEVRGTEA